MSPLTAPLPYRRDSGSTGAPATSGPKNTDMLTLLSICFLRALKNISARELARIVDRVGGQHNAATNREYTCYYINVISDHIELALEILSDMYYHPLFDKDELEKEKNVILEEIMMYEDTPDELVHDLFIESMMKGHPLSHSILGTTTTIGTPPANR